MNPLVIVDSDAVLMAQTFELFPWLAPWKGNAVKHSGEQALVFFLLALTCFELVESHQMLGSDALG